MTTPAIAAPQLWVGLARCSAISPAQALTYRQLLSPTEIARNQRYRFERDRHRDLIARALVRTALAERFDAEPAELQFDIDAKGKPHLGAWPRAQKHAVGAQDNAAKIDGRQPPTLCFNLAHSGDWVVLAIAGFRVGIDVEYTQRKNDVLGIARHYFFGAEVEQLFSYPEAQQKERFFDYWTLKEAYIKARGEGISLGLSNFGFTLPDLSSSSEILLYTKPCLNDDPAAWQFCCATPEPDYRLSIAARTEHAYQLVCQEVVPLQSCTDLAWQFA